MKIWEVIKKVTEDKSKVFKCIGVNGDEMFVKMYDECQVLGGCMINVLTTYGESTDNVPLSLNATTIEYEWEEVIELVDTFTAFNDCKKNGTKYNSYSKSYNQTLEMDRNDMGSVRITDTVFNGRPVILDVEWIKQS